MSTVHVVVELLRPAFHGHDGDGHATWPPSPLRLAQALMAGCNTRGRDDSAIAALAALVSLDAPRIHTGDAVAGKIPPTYASRSGVPKDAGRARPADLLKWIDIAQFGFAARNRVAKPQDACFLSDPRIVYAVQDPQDSVDVPSLDRAARRVPYFGRSQDVCAMSVTTDPPELPPRTWWADPASRDRADVSTRGWSTRSLDWMELKHRLTTEGSAIPVPDPVPAFAPAWRYRTAARPTHPHPRLAPSSTLTILAFARRRPHAESMQIAAAVRGALARGGSDVHVFPCVHVGHRHADGSGHGVAFAGPTNVEAARVGYDDLVSAAGVALREFPDLFAEADVAPSAHTLQPARWTRAESRWVSATPLRAFPDERVLAYHLPTWVRAHGAELLSWSAHRHPSNPWQHRCRQPPDGQDTWWLTIETDRPIPGPLRLGTSTDLGYGLFAPGGEPR